MKTKDIHLTEGGKRKVKKILHETKYFEGCLFLWMNFIYLFIYFMLFRDCFLTSIILRCYFFERLRHEM